MENSEVLFSFERDFIIWRAENPELWAALVACFLVLVVALCAFWYVCDHMRKVERVRVMRERERRRRVIRMNGGL